MSRGLGDVYKRQEQRAALAELPYFDDLDDEELRQFAAHVRP